MTVRTSRAQQAVDIVREWVERPAMTALLAAVIDLAPSDSRPWLHLSERLPGWLVGLLAGTEDARSSPPVQLLEKVIALERRAAESFDFRSRDDGTYRERSEAVEAHLDERTRALVLDQATSLGLVSPTKPAYDAYDMTLILGGGFRSPLLRSRYAALLERQGTDLGDIHLLGSPRFLITNEPAEHPVTSVYAPNAADEFDLMVAAASLELGLSGQPVRFLCGCTSASTICPNWPSRNDPRAVDTPAEYTHERGANLLSREGRSRGEAFSARTSRPPYRPDTSDTLALWARYANPMPGQRVLVVTTQVFVPFQGFDGLRRLYLPFGLTVDTVGFSAEWGDRPLSAEYLLQETLSALRSARRLLVDAIAILLSGEESDLPLRPSSSV